jgi:hypothetical protein
LIIRAGTPATNTFDGTSLLHGNEISFDEKIIENKKLK